MSTHSGDVLMRWVEGGDAVAADGGSTRRVPDRRLLQPVHLPTPRRQDRDG